MADGLEALANMEYPGRLIIVGRDLAGVHNIVVYGITGRSASSQARKLVEDESSTNVYVKPIDESLITEGNRGLLVYPALYFSSRGVVVSNGAQTQHLRQYVEQNWRPIEVILKAHDWWSYEPDPNNTPRISGCVTREAACLGIIKRNGVSEDPLRYYFQIPLISGRGKMIATYTGQNVDPLPSFSGEPFDVALLGSTAKDIAVSVYGALTPQNPQRDYRVAVACVFNNIETAKREVTIINRADM